MMAKAYFWIALLCPKTGHETLIFPQKALFKPYIWFQISFLDLQMVFQPTFEKRFSFLSLTCYGYFSLFVFRKARSPFSGNLLLLYPFIKKALGIIPVTTVQFLSPVFYAVFWSISLLINYFIIFTVKIFFLLISLAFYLVVLLTHNYLLSLTNGFLNMTIMTKWISFTLI